MRLLLLFLTGLIAFAIWREGLLTGVLLMSVALLLGMGAAVFYYAYICLRQKNEEMWEENP